MTATASTPRRRRAPARGRLGVLVLTVSVATLLAWSAPVRAADPAVNAAPGASRGGQAEHKPELITKPGATQIITSLTTLVVFCLLVVVLGKYAWGPIVSSLKAREDRIRKDIADAEAARERAEATLREYNTRLATAEQQVRDLLAKASRDAEQIAVGVRTRAQQEAEETKERATRDIEAARNQAISQIYEEAANISTAVAEKILQRNLNPDDQRELVNRSLEQLRTTANN